MMKKLVALMLSLVLVVFSYVALAGSVGVPSVITDDLIKVVGVETESGVAVAADFVAQVVGTSVAASAELAKIFAAVSNGVAPVNYFAADVVSAVKALLPAGVNAEKLVMNEFAPLTITKYDSAYGAMTVSFEFATKYKDGQSLVALVGYVSGKDAAGNNVVTWIPLQAEAVNGVVKIHFTQEALELLDGKEAMIAILSAE